MCIWKLDSYVCMHFCALAYANPEFNTEFFNKSSRTMVQNTWKLGYLQVRLPRSLIYCGQNHGSDEFSGKTSIDTSTHICHCEYVIKQGLNKSGMEQSTSSCDILRFCLNDTDLGLSKAYYVSTFHRV